MACTRRPGRRARVQKDFTADDELANVESGLLGIVPLTYKVVGTSNVHGADPGEQFTLPLLLGQEQLLIEGGHIELVEPEKAKPARKPAKKETDS